jgi:hypothetical protein
MPWQRQVAATALECDAGGVLRYPLVVVTVPRQSGKTTLLRPVFARECLFRQDASTWLTAQKRGDARDTWLGIVKVLERSSLAPMLSVRRANGTEAVNWANGSELRIFAPSEEALHGKTTRLVGVDEAWAFDAVQGTALMQAIVPTQATQPGAQVWIVSTAGTARSQWLRAMVEQGRADSGKAGGGVAYFEWSIPEDADPTDLDVYAAHHPALGRTITRRSLSAAMDVMGPAEFARAYGNLWTTSDAFAIAPELWEGCRTHEPFAEHAPIAFAVETAADRSATVIMAASQLADGRTAMEVVEHRGGVAWAIERVRELAKRHRPVAVVIDPIGPARPVWTGLTERRPPVTSVADFGAAELIAAQTELLDGLTGRRIAHRSHERLDAALAAATIRRVREVEVFSRQVAADGASPAALIAGMLALWGLSHPVEQARPTVRHAGKP